MEDAVLGIIRETLVNVRKHAAAHNVLIRFNFSDELAQVDIVDDDTGFTPPEQPSTLLVEGYNMHSAANEDELRTAHCLHILLAVEKSLESFCSPTIPVKFITKITRKKYQNCL